MQIETLGDAYTHSVRIKMRCAWGKRDAMKSVRECLFSTELDVQTLVCTRGRDMPITFLQERMRCPQCGSRRVRLLFDVPSNSGAGAVSAPLAKSARGY